MCNDMHTHPTPYTQTNVFKRAYIVADSVLDTGDKIDSTLYYVVTWNSTLEYSE